MLPDSVRVGVGQGVSVSGVYKVRKPFGPCMSVPTVNLKIYSRQAAFLKATVLPIVFTCLLFLQEKYVLLLELYY